MSTPMHECPLQMSMMRVFFLALTWKSYTEKWLLCLPQLMQGLGVPVMEAAEPEVGMVGELPWWLADPGLPMPFIPKLLPLGLPEMLPLPKPIAPADA